MNFIRTETADRLLIATLSRGAANPLNAVLIEELHAVLSEAQAPGVRGLLLASDRPRCFSAGFDVTEVFQYNRAAMTSCFGSFIDLYDGLFRLPKPVGAALSGHAIAGGAVLELASDLRVMTEGPFQFALNEVNLGVALPPGVIRMAVDAIGVHHARNLFLAGEPISPQRALEIGLVSELAMPQNVLQRTIARTRALAEKPAAAFAAMKRTLIDVTGHTSSDREHLPQFIDQWFSPESEQRRRILIESLQRKRR